MFSNFIEPIRIEEIAFQDSIISFLLRLRLRSEGEERLLRFLRFEEKKGRTLRRRRKGRRGREINLLLSTFLFASFFFEESFEGKEAKRKERKRGKENR